MRNVAQSLRPVVAALVGLLLGVGLTAFAGENPWQVLVVIIQGAVGTSYDLGMTLFYATPLIFTGLAVALPFRAGLFNIGAEGQLLMGAVAVAALGVSLPNIPAPYSAVLAVLVAFAGGALWGAMAGWLRAYRGSHEVITTIMLNFVAAGLTSWVVLALIPSTDSQNPESAKIGAGYMWHAFSLFGGAPVTAALLLAGLVALGIWLALKYTVRGFELKATGLNTDAARFAGIDTRLTQLWVMAIGGGLAGLVGVAEVCGNSGRFRLGFSPDYGFIGIPVALMARAHPLGLVASALMFGILQKGTSELDLETDHVTKDLAGIIQAMVVLAVAADGALAWLMRLRRQTAAKGGRAHG
ncbi:MAG: ABC transporter permease [Deltaproteobacteria bacterium]|nr:ABC transporter permease [Deltaproteobacteria bacterium]